MSDSLNLFDPSNYQASSSLLLQAANQYVVKPTGAPKQTIGISGFIFQIIDDEEMQIESDITDHYVEMNYAVQDHIALRPERFTLRGFIGELNDQNASPISLAIAVIDRLQNLTSISPVFVASAQQIYDTLAVVVTGQNAGIQAAGSLYNLFTGKNTSATLQQDAFNYFYSMWLNQQLCTVETPWQIFYNMAIESVRPVQRGDSPYVTEFSVRFKRIRMNTDTLSSNPLSSLISAVGRAFNMTTPTTLNGPVTGSYADVTNLTSSPLFNAETSSLF